MNNYIDKSANLGKGCEIGFNSVILEDVRIGDAVKIGNNVSIREGSIIGDRVVINDNAIIGKRPQASKTGTLKISSDIQPVNIGASCIVGCSSIIYAGAKIGQEVFIGDYASIREDTEIGDFSIIGCNVSVDNKVIIGKYVRVQTGAYITSLSILEDYTFIAPNVAMANDNFLGRTQERFKYRKGPHVKKGARIGINATLLPGIVIGEEGVVAAGSVVTRDVPPYKLVMGVPARVVRDVPKEQLITHLLHPEGVKSG
ncbi:MAG: DapH/DapD/GlmU-related protein [bacterium]|nr:DapH/DapD/GlmU-related protein [bacterium]